MIGVVKDFFKVVLKSVCTGHRTVRKLAYSSRKKKLKFLALHSDSYNAIATEKK
jgi:hypothetical protein